MLKNLPRHPLLVTHRMKHPFSSLNSFLFWEPGQKKSSMFGTVALQPSTGASFLVHISYLPPLWSLMSHSLPLPLQYPVANSILVLFFPSASITILFCIHVLSALCAAFLTGPSLRPINKPSIFELFIKALLFCVGCSLLSGAHSWSHHPISPQFLCHSLISATLVTHLRQENPSGLQENPLGRDWFYPNKFIKTTFPLNYSLFLLEHIWTEKQQIHQGWRGHPQDTGMGGHSCARCAEPPELAVLAPAWAHTAPSTLQSCFSAVLTGGASTLVHVIREKTAKWDPHVHYEKSSAWNKVPNMFCSCLRYHHY